MKWHEEWVEAFTLFLLVLGFLISMLLRSDMLSYVAISLSGALAGRAFYTRRFSEPILPFVLMVVGFLLGYVLGSFWTSRLLTIVLFGVGFGLSYFLHMKKIIGIFKSKQFIK